jgi:hypothetical protein
MIFKNVNLDCLICMQNFEVPLQVANELVLLIFKEEI